MSPKTAARPVTDLTKRLEAAQRAVVAHEKALSNERELRRRLVVQAIDEGMPYRAVAAALGVGTGAVSKIVSKPDPDDEE